MRKKLLGFGLGLALLTGSTAAWAGGKGFSPVYINITTRYASGSMGDARNSPDMDQSISITIEASGSTEFAYVNFRDATNLHVVCTTSNPTLISVMKAAVSDATIRIQWNQYGECTSFATDNKSAGAPKAP